MTKLNSAVDVACDHQMTAEDLRDMLLKTYLIILITLKKIQYQFNIPIKFNSVF